MCSSCSRSDGTNICLSCEDGAHLLNGVCKSCDVDVEHCTKCTASTSGNTVCVACADGFFLFENSCVDECPFGTYATKINSGQEDLKPLNVCKLCETTNFNKACLPTHRVYSAKSCMELQWPSRGSSDVCSGALFNDRCMVGTKEQAQQLCAAAGARLCTRGEVLNDFGALTGCNDDKRIWTSSQNDYCNGQSGITVGGSSAVADSLEPLCSQTSEDHAITCCADGEYTPTDPIFDISTELKDMGDGFATCWLLGWESNGGSDFLCSASEIKGECHASKTYDEAVAICESVGAFLCSMAILVSDGAAGPQCDFDNSRVWSDSADNCEPSQQLTGAGASQYAGDFPIECTAVSERANVRCCAYAKTGEKAFLDSLVECPSGIYAFFGGFKACVTSTITGSGYCHSDKSFEEAELVCANEGKRLCTAEEVSNEAYSSDCPTFAEQRVWTTTSSDCPDDQHQSRAGTDSFLWKHPEQCTAKDSKHNVLCCPVEDPCENIICPEDPNECAGTPVCVAGACVSNPGAGDSVELCDGERGVCTSDGECKIGEDACDKTQCEALDECHEVGTCSGGICDDPIKADGTACSNGNGQCQVGVCVVNDGACDNIECSALDDCHDIGTCAGGSCNNPVKAFGTACNNGKGQCQGGACVDASCDGVQCEPKSECHNVGTCGDGVCTEPMKADGTSCNDGNGTCQLGECVNKECGLIEAFLQMLLGWLLALFGLPPFCDL